MTVGIVVSPQGHYLILSVLISFRDRIMRLGGVTGRYSQVLTPTHTTVSFSGFLHPQLLAQRDFTVGKQKATTMKKKVVVHFFSPQKVKSKQQQKVL